MTKRYKEPETAREIEETIRMLESGEMNPPKGCDMGPAYQGPADEEALTKEETIAGLRLRLKRG